jgi:hypothetical protein
MSDFFCECQQDNAHIFIIVMHDRCHALIGSDLMVDQIKDNLQPDRGMASILKKYACIGGHEWHFPSD